MVLLQRVFRTNRQGKFNVPKARRQGKMQTRRIRQFLKHSETFPSFDRKIYLRSASRMAAREILSISSTVCVATTRRKGEYDTVIWYLDFSRLLNASSVWTPKVSNFYCLLLQSKTDSGDQQMDCRTVRVGARAGFRWHRRQLEKLLISNYRTVA